MKDLLRMMESGKDMNGTDSSWYAKKKGEEPKYVYQTQQKKLSDEKIMLGRYWREQGHTWTWISRKLGCHESTCRRNCT